MKILNLYVTKSFLATFLMAIGVLTFGMAGAQLIRIFDSLAQGIPGSVALEMLIYSLPHALCFTLPWASLVAIMLVFGRLSADSEITAMRACGVSILQIVAPLIVTTIIFTAICLQLQLNTGPRTMEKARKLGMEVVVNHPLALFTPGMPVNMEDFMPGTSLYFASKDAEDNIYYVQLYRVVDQNIHEDITAARGRIEVDKEHKMMQIVLFDAQITTRSGDRNHDVFMKEFKMEWDYGKQFNASRIAMREKFLPLKDLLARIVVLKREGQDTTKHEVELSTRVCLALAPIAFLLLGLPLAIQTNRRETSVGLFLSVLLAGVYFANVLLAEALRKSAALYPQYLIWLVPFLYQAFGIYYIAKIARK
ncbi:MAG: YjgP/YjgQ family permease [Lentisphaerae bacterium]|nr:YjgP/YjgQ family permease [Lentisphaerota bacterium]